MWREQPSSALCATPTSEASKSYPKLFQEAIFAAHVGCGAGGTHCQRAPIADLGLVFDVLFDVNVSEVDV